MRRSGASRPPPPSGPHPAGGPPSGSDHGSIGPAISLPIFTGSLLEGAYRGARAEYDASVAAYDAAVTRALHDVADVVVSERALAARLLKTREALAASEDAYRIIDMRYRGGLSTYLEVLSVEESLIANQQAVADLETRAFALDIALVRALGGGFRRRKPPATGSRSSSAYPCASRSIATIS